MSILNPMTTILIRKGKERFETPKRKKTQTEKGKGSVITEAKKKKRWFGCGHKPRKADSHQQLGDKKSVLLKPQKGMQPC